MRKRLAIKGHFTRGWEVIELLEMLGGVNGKINKTTGEVYNTYNGDYFIHEICDSREVAYYIDFESQIRRIDIKDITTHFIVYSLEMFLKIFPFKVGDKVIDTADGCPGVVREMKWDEDISDMKYYVAFENGVDFGWFTNDSINFFEIKKNENLEENKFPSFEPMFKMNDELEYKIPDGYEITEVSKGKVFIKPIKSKYPTNYQECCDVLGLPTQNALKYINKDCNKHDYYNDLQSTLNCFVSLKMCRDAYWKIAGEQMGLDKPWEPDWNITKSVKLKYGIALYNDTITKMYLRNENVILAFPNEKMRDAFYENFKDLIEQCKELL